MMEIVGENCKVNSDHISRLPDTILQHILSFLETKIAAQSSVLSRSWRDLWTYAPCLIFECRTSEWGLYSAMLRYQSSTLRRLSFSASHAYYDTRNAVCQWIAFAMRHDVEELILTLHSSSCNTELNELPKGVFSFRSLRILKLSSCRFGDVGTPDLASLQVLSFYDVRAKDETLSLLIACCPVLKKLGLKSCQSITQLDLSLLELKKMTIRYCDRLTSFKADAPKLRLAKYGGYMEDSEISLRSTVGLMGAKLQLCELNKGVSGFVNLAREFGRARVLTIKCTGHLLRESSIKLKSLLERCSPCYNVKQLVLQLGPASSVVALLKIFPKLEDLTMEQDKCSRIHHSYNSGSAWREQSDCGSEIHNLGATSVKCLKHCLKKITFERFRGYDDEVALAKVLVKNAMVLEEMNINDCWGPVNLHLNIKNKLTKMRGCKSAKIIYN